MTPLWQLFVSGAVGSSLTYAFTWWRERKRMQDAYRAPQRVCIGDYITASHELLLASGDWRHLMTEMIENGRNGRRRQEQVEATKASAGRMSGEALLGVERAFRIAAMTVVDAKCWEALASSYTRFEELRDNYVDGTKRVSGQDVVLAWIAESERLSREFERANGRLVIAAIERLAPVETIRGKREREKARRRMEGRLGGPFAIYPADETRPPPERQG